MTTVYARLMMPVKSVASNSIVGDQHMTDPSRSVIDALIATRVQWVHEYYWPGDDYYVFVKFTKGSDVARKLATLGTLEYIDGHYIHHQKEVRTFFDEKYPSIVRNNHGNVDDYDASGQPA